MDQNAAAVLSQVARRVAPCVVCFDDAHMNFPGNISRMSDAGAAASIARMIVELDVQLQQLADMQVHLETSASQPQQQQQKGNATPARRSQKTSSGGGAASESSSALRPVWGFFGCKSKTKKQQDAADSSDAASRAAEQLAQQHAAAYSKMGGPIVVVFVTPKPQSLDEALLQQLPVQLLLDLPASDAREDLLMGWLMEREAAVNVQDVEWLAR